jgi:hypothetical protein
MDRAGDVDGQDRTPPARSRNQSPRPNDGHHNRRDGSGSQWTSSLDYSIDGNNNNGLPTTAGGGHDPLASIPAQPINPSLLNMSFMPPPSSVYYNYCDQNASSPTADHSPTVPLPAHEGPPGTPQDWFALPLDQFFNTSTAGIDQGLGGPGPIVGEFDMLEVLFDEQYDRDGEGGDSAGGATNGLPSHFM